MELKSKTCPSCGGTLVIEGDTAFCQYCQNRYSVEGAEKPAAASTPAWPEHPSADQAAQRLKHELDELNARYNSVKDEISSTENVLQGRRSSGLLIVLAVFLALGGWAAFANGGYSGGSYNWWALGPIFIAILIFRSGINRRPRGRHSRRMLREAYFRLDVLQDQIRKKNLELEKFARH
jgi:uncharacterized Zn finger protein (UPF0148 family)